MNDMAEGNAKAQRIGIAADHGGFELKQFLYETLTAAGYSIQDYGNKLCDPDDDYPDYVVPLAQAIHEKKIDRGIAICGSGVGASVVANKIPGVRAALIHETFSAHQGVEDDDMNMICLGGRVIGHSLALELVNTFLTADFIDTERFVRRLEKVKLFEKLYDTTTTKNTL